MSHIIFRNLVPFDWNGLQIRDITPTDLLSASVAIIDVLPSLGHEKARSRSSDKIYVCLEGLVSFNVEGEVVKLEPMDLLLVYKNEWFDYRNVGDSVSRLILLHVPRFDPGSEEFFDSARQ